MTDAEEYELSLYSTVEVLRKNNESVVEIVNNSLDDKKYIKKTYFSDARAIYNILTQIDCCNIPKVYNVFFETDTIVIEEYIEGQPLHDMLTTGSSVDSEEIFKGLLDALVTLQEKGIVHRDIKPSNVVIRNDGTPVLVDFGIARKYSKLRDTDTVKLGTEGFAAPEQFGYSQSDFRTDIFALGKTMEAIETYFKLPKHIKKIVGKCVAFDPDSRYQNAVEVKNAIRGCNVFRVMPVVVISVAAIVVIISFIYKGYIISEQNGERNLSDNIENQHINEFGTHEIIDHPLQRGFDGVWYGVDDNLEFTIFDTDGKLEIDADFGHWYNEDIVSYTDDYLCAVNLDDEGNEHKVEMTLSDDGKNIIVKDFPCRNGKIVEINKTFRKAFEWTE